MSLIGAGGIMHDKNLWLHLCSRHTPPGASEQIKLPRMPYRDLSVGRTFVNQLRQVQDFLGRIAVAYISLTYQGRDGQSP
jgi:hypothetical protein